MIEQAIGPTQVLLWMVMVGCPCALDLSWLSIEQGASGTFHSSSISICALQVVSHWFPLHLIPGGRDSTEAG